MTTNDVVSINTYVSHPVMVFADVTGFTHFAQRTIEEPDLVRSFMVRLLNEFFLYEKITGCIIKIECDGLVAIHPSGPVMDSHRIIGILTECVRLHGKADALIRSLPYPRPEGFRIRVTTGATWTMTAILSQPVDCENETCRYRTLTDTFGYPGILASRLQQIHKEIPLICCQTVYESAMKGPVAGIEFIKLKRDRIVLDGVFPEDIRSLWSFRSSAM